MQPNFTNPNIHDTLMLIRDSQKLTFGNLQQPPNQHRHMGPFWNSLQLACGDWRNIGLETGLYPLFYDPIFCREYDINPLLQFSDSSVPLKDNHLNLAVEALNNCPSDISYSAQAVIQWAIFWIDFCLKELDEPTVFVL